MKPRKSRTHRGSSLLFLGFSVIAFLITYGIMYLLLASVLGQFYTALESVDIGSADWQAMYDNVSATVQFIIPLAATAGLFIFVIKVLMVASVRGRD